jgi:hypothetical protein
LHIIFHNFIAFVHVFLFVFAIGGDIAVHYIGQYLTRDKLSLEERLRVRQMRFIVDMSARSALVLLLPVGFTLAQAYGSPISGNWLVTLWMASLLWLLLVWLVHVNKGTPLGERLGKLDIGIRYAVIIAMASFGGYCLITGGPIAHTWLAIKIVLFAVILLNGLWIRQIVKRWPAAFELVKAGGQDAVRGEVLIKELQTKTNRAALCIWILVVLMAFFGEVKPY